jgi:hypothetical protein
LRTHVEAHPSNLSHGINRRKTLEITRTKIGSKIPPKIKKIKNISAHRGDSIQTHGSIDANQEFIRCGNQQNILPLFGRLRRSLTYLLFSLRHEAHTTPSKMKT